MSVGQGEVVDEVVDEVVEMVVEMANKSNRLKMLIGVIFFDSQKSNHSQMNQSKVQYRTAAIKNQR